MAIRDEPSANGNANAWDPTDVDLPTLAGVVLRIEVAQQLQGLEQARQGRILDKIAASLEIPVDKSDPPPPFRKQLDSHREEIEALQKARDEGREEIQSLQKSRAEELAQIEALKKVDAEVTGKMQAVTEDVAATKVIIRVGLIEGIPKVIKVGGGLTAAIIGLTLLISQIWAAFKGH